MAVDATVQVGDDFFEPQAVQIDPGNTVTWEWVGLMGNHSVTTRPGQIESFDSDPGNDNPRHTPRSTPFARRFDQVGRIKYFCKLHPTTMNGTVTVGTPAPDTTPPVIDPAKPKVGERSIKVGFELSERAVVRLTVASKGKPNRALRSIARQLEAGRHTIRVRRGSLPLRRYIVKLTAEDEAGNDSPVVKASFRLKPPRR